MDRRWRLPRETHAPFQARRAVGDLVQDFQWRAGDIMLVVSELVTNSVRHATGGPIEVRARRTPRNLEVEVCDPPPGFELPAFDLDHARLGQGRVGLALVDALTDEWGIRTDGEACVWARFDRPSQTAA